MKNLISKIKNKNLNLLDSKISCNADFVLYEDINRYILTIPIIKTEELDSTLNPIHIPIKKLFNLV